jgi:branched-chain amino acid aminotransferase
MNLFIVRDGKLATPDTSQGILEGITRDTVMLLAREIGLEPAEERPVDRTELYIADEVFLCGTAAQIAPVTRVDGRAVGDGTLGPITLRLQGAYDRLVRTFPGTHPEWIAPVYSDAGSSVR